MLKNMIVPVWAASLIAFPAFAGDYKFQAKAGDSQTVEYQQGNGTVFSKRDNSEVDISYLQPFVGKRAEFLLTVVNNGQDSINVDISNVTVAYADQPLHLYSADELTKITNGRAGWATFAVALAGGLDAAAASTPSTSTTYGHVGRTAYSSTTTTYNTNYYAQAAAQDRTQRNLDQLTDAKNATLNEIQNNALQLTTVKPGQPYTTKICIDRPKDLTGVPLEITVTVGADIHKFAFDVSKG